MAGDNDAETRGTGIIDEEQTPTECVDGHEWCPGPQAEEELPCFPCVLAAGDVPPNDDRADSLRREYLRTVGSDHNLF